MSWRQEALLLTLYFRHPTPPQVLLGAGAMSWRLLAEPHGRRWRTPRHQRQRAAGDAIGARPYFSSRRQHATPAAIKSRKAADTPDPRRLTASPGERQHAAPRTRSPASPGTNPPGRSARDSRLRVVGGALANQIIRVRRHAAAGSGATRIAGRRFISRGPTAALARCLAGGCGTAAHQMRTAHIISRAVPGGASSGRERCQLRSMRGIPRAGLDGGQTSLRQQSHDTSFLIVIRF